MCMPGYIHSRHTHVYVLCHNLKIYQDIQEELRQRNRESGKSRKREEFDSEEDSPPRKAPPLRRRAVIESDED